MKNKNFSKYLKILVWPVLFWIGQFLLLLLVEILYSQYHSLDNFSDFINENSYIIGILNIVIFLPIFYHKYQCYQNNYTEKLKHPIFIILIAILISSFLNEIILIIKVFLNVEMTANLNIYLLINTILIGPILEEYLFRGIVFNQLLEFNSEKKSIYLTTLLFAIMHGNIFSILYAFIVGIFLNGFYLKERTMKANILFHIVINFISSFIIPWIYLSI